MPGLFEGVTTADMMGVRVMAGEGEYRSDPQSEGWIGKAVAEVLGLDHRRTGSASRRWSRHGSATAC